MSGFFSENLIGFTRRPRVIIYSAVPMPAAASGQRRMSLGYDFYLVTTAPPSPSKICVVVLRCVTTTGGDKSRRRKAARDVPVTWAIGAAGEGANDEIEKRLTCFIGNYIRTNNVHYAVVRIKI